MNFKKERAEVRDSVDTSYILERSKFVDVDIQKTFSDRKWVWIPDTQNSFLPGWVVQEKGDIIEVDCDGDVRECKSSEVMRMNPPKFDMVEDLAALSHLNEPSVLYNLTKRYKHGSIYTYSGLFLLAMNPYRELDIYSPNYIKKYTMNKKNELDPHIFAVSNEAYNLMLSNNENQSILITGESGAGKTENTKKVIEFLASVAGYRTESVSIDKKIIVSNPILEAFGNAKTIKNDNSSRFGKFIQIKFNGGNICGANVEKYLLEKSRITGQNSNERNYHIFYQLLYGADSGLKQALFLDGFIDDYRFLKSGCHTIEGVDDAERFKMLRNCMRALDIDEKTELFYYKIVAAVLHLGNLEFEMNNKQVEITNIGTVDKICRLLSISSSDFIKCLIHPVIKAGHEIVTQHRTVEQVYRIVEALAKILYDKMFDSLISNLNRCLGTTVNSTFIGVLDIAGFEIFKENSFEQLCINYTNEKLQQFFNHHMFILEQDIYRQENIDWNFIDFGLDLQPTIDLIESNNPIGIMAYLDEECVMPCASDKTFLEKLVKNIKNTKFRKINFKDGFNLQHYAGDVEYSVNEWITKNKDPNFESITSLINKSEDAEVSGLSFAESKNLKKGFFRTVSQKHKEQLLSLMKTLASTNPHFVRCIIPNLQKRGDVVENKLILEQLKCNGVLEGIRISRQGFPSRMRYSEFVERYQFLSDLTKSKSIQMDNREIAQKILSEIKISSSQFRLGKTKIFFRQGVLADIEDIRDIRISHIMREVQCIARRKMALRKFNVEELRKKSIVCLKKNARLCVELQNWNWWKLYLKIKPLLDVRKRDNEIKEKENTIKKYLEVIDKERSKIKELEKKIKELGENNETLMKNIESEKQYTYEKDELMNAIREKNKELEDKIKIYEEESANTQLFLEKTMSKLETDGLVYQRSLEELKDKLRNSEIKIQELEEKVLEKENEIKDSYLKLHNTESESKSQFEKFVESKEKEVENFKKKVCKLENLLIEKESIKESLEKDIGDLKRELQKEIEDKEKEKAFIEKERKAYADFKNSQEVLVKKLKEENSDLQIDNEKFEAENSKLQRQNEEKESKIKKLLGENDIIKLNNSNHLKTISILKDQLQEKEKREEEERENKAFRDSTHESLMDKIKVLEKRNKTLSEKNKHLEHLNLQLTEEKEEIHKENLNLLQSKLDDIFQRESEFNSIKNKLQVENQKLINENQRITRELYDQRIQSESSDDSTSGAEKLYGLLEQEKKIRRETEQKLIEKENLILILRNENEELRDKNEELLKEKNALEEDLHNQRTKTSDYLSLSKEVDTLLDDINMVIEGINTKYFTILADCKERINEALKNVEKKEEEIKDLNSKLLDSSNLITDLEEKNMNLTNLNSVQVTKISHFLNEFDSLKITSLSLATELEEKNKEIEIYKEEIDKVQEAIEETRKKSRDELNSYKEESESIIQSLRTDQANLILNLKNKENRMKDVYEEKIKNVLEIEKKKKCNLIAENENLKNLNSELENKIHQEMTLNSELNRMVTKLELEIEEIKVMKDKIGGDNPSHNTLLDTSMVPSNKSIVYITDKQKLKDLERKKLIFQNELKSNQELIEDLKKKVEKFEGENSLLKGERLNLKNQVFELKKNSNTLSVKLSQVERELKDEKELVHFLKPFSLSRRIKK